MKKMKISLGSIEAVKEFVALTNSYSFDSDLVSGRYAVDAKSIICLLYTSPSPRDTR